MPAIAYGPRDDITIRHWREAHADPDRVRAWCAETGRPASRGAIARELRDAYLAERGHEVRMPGGLSREEAYAALRVLTRTFSAMLGPFQVTYGPCPRCGKPTSALPGEPLPPCGYCSSGPGGEVIPIRARGQGAAR